MKKIPLRNRQRQVVAYSLIDNEDYDKVSAHRWCRDANGYAVSAFYIDRKTFNIKLSRYLTDAPKGMDVDHINRDKLDNRKKNLRICTRSQNNINQLAKSNNSSGHKGIGWDKARSKWRAQIKVNGKSKSIGRFENLEDAIVAYREQAKIAYGEFLPKEIYA